MRVDEGGEAAARVLALAARLVVLRGERDAEAAGRLLALAEVERLQELVVALQVRLAAVESAPVAPRPRGLASLITPPQAGTGT